MSLSDHLFIVCYLGLASAFFYHPPPGYEREALWAVWIVTFFMVMWACRVGHKFGSIIRAYFKRTSVRVKPNTWEAEHPVKGCFLLANKACVECGDMFSGWAWMVPSPYLYTPRYRVEEERLKYERAGKGVRPLPVSTAVVPLYRSFCANYVCRECSSTREDATAWRRDHIEKDKLNELVRRAAL